MLARSITSRKLQMASFCVINSKNSVNAGVENNIKDAGGGVINMHITYPCNQLLHHPGHVCAQTRLLRSNYSIITSPWPFVCSDPLTSFQLLNYYITLAICVLRPAYFVPTTQSLPHPGLVCAQTRLLRSNYSIITSPWPFVCRKRKLIVDETKAITGEEMKAQLSDTSDIVTTLGKRCRKCG